MTTADDVTVRHGDALKVLAGMPDGSVDAVVTDPPAGIAFMGKSWDDFKRSREEFVGWLAAVLEECLRVAKPGAHAVVWALPRTSGWTHRAIEDAGWEVRECVTHLFGSGFPKSLDVSKAIDRAAGADREVVGRKADPRYDYDFNDAASSPMGNIDPRRERSDHAALTAPATPDAEKWQGWGTALKPGSEHWWMARKPLAGTVAANVLEHGTGALNIDGCRLEAGQDYRDKCASVVGLSSNRNGDAYGEWTGIREDSASPAGRWPANVVLDEDAAAELDRQSGNLATVGGPKSTTHDAGMFGIGQPGRIYTDQGGASRFYYTAKARPDERPFYYRPACDCEEPWPTTSRARATAATTTPADSSTSKSGNATTNAPSPTATRSTTSTGTSSTTTPPTSSPSRPPNTSESTPAANSATGNGGNPAEPVASTSQSQPNTGTSPSKGGRSTADAAHATSAKWSATSVCGECGQPARREAHATVKPLELMRWLVRLVTPPGGLVLDPFAGSGTTGEACLIEGFRCVLVEREDAYLPLIEARLNKPLQPVLGEELSA